MQLLIDTKDDGSPELMHAARLLLNVLSERDGVIYVITRGIYDDAPDVPAGTRAESVQQAAPAVVLPATASTEEVSAALEQVRDFQARLAGFGKAPLPAEAIAIDVPAAFTAPAPPPPLATSAPTPSNPSPIQSATGAVEEDSDGYVWDKRIHSSSKKKHPDGRWHLRRGVDSETLAKVKAELRNAEELDAAIANAAVGSPFMQDVVSSLLAATSPAVPPPPAPPHSSGITDPAIIENMSRPGPAWNPAPPPPPVVTPATAQTLNFTAQDIAALYPVPPPPPRVFTAPAADLAAQPANTTAAVLPVPAIALPTMATAGIAPPASATAAVPASATTTSHSSSGVPKDYIVGATVADFKTLMAQKVTPAMQAGRVKTGDLIELCKRHGLNGLQDLVPTHPKVQDIANELDKMLGLA